MTETAATPSAEPEATPPSAPEEVRSEALAKSAVAPEVAPLTCSDCGAEIPATQVIALQNLCLCLEDGGHRALEILSTHGTHFVSIRDIEMASAALELAARLLRVKRLRQFSGAQIKHGRAA